MEGYVYTFKNQVQDKEKLGSKLSDDDKETITRAVEETISWLEDHQEATEEEYEAQKKKLEEVVQPTISKLYEEREGANKDEL